MIYDDIDQNFSTNENNNEQKERARLYTAERIMNEEFRWRGCLYVKNEKRNNLRNNMAQKRMMNNVLKMDTTTTRQKSTDNSGIMRRRSELYITRE